MSCTKQINDAIVEIVTTLRDDPQADVSEKAAAIMGVVRDLAGGGVDRYEELLAAVLFASGTPVFELERADLAEVASTLGAHPGVKVERWPQGFISESRPAGAKPIVMRLTLENSADREVRVYGVKREG